MIRRLAVSTSGYLDRVISAFISSRRLLSSSGGSSKTRRVDNSTSPIATSQESHPLGAGSISSTANLINRMHAFLNRHCTKNEIAFALYTITLLFQSSQKRHYVPYLPFGQQLAHVRHAGRRDGLGGYFA